MVNLSEKKKNKERKQTRKENIWQKWLTAAKIIWFDCLSTHECLITAVEWEEQLLQKKGWDCVILQNKCLFLAYKRFED